MSTFKDKLTLKELPYIALALIAATLPFSISANSISIVLCLLTTIPFFKKDNFGKPFQMLLLPLLFILFLASGIYSPDVHEYAARLERKLSFFALPLIFLCIPRLIEKKQAFWEKTIAITFLVALTIAALYSFRVGTKIFVRSPSLEEINSAIIIQRPKFGMYCGGAIIICTFLWRHATTPFAKYALALTMLFFTLFMYLIFAKMAMISFILSLALFTLYKLHLRFALKGLSIAVLAITIAGIALVFINPSLQKIFWGIVEAKKFSIEGENFYIFNSFNDRFIFWKCGLEAIAGLPAMIGYGLGGTQPILEFCYESLNFYLQGQNFNVHNQYLQTTLQIGLVGLIVMLGALITTIYYLLKHKRIEYALFILFYALCMITESTFSTQKGIVFYAFFNSFFIYFAKKKDSDG